MSTIKPEVHDLSAKLAKDITVAKDGLVTVAEDIYLKHAPTGITKASEDLSADYRATFFAAVTDAAGEQVLKHMKKNKDLEAVKVVVPITGKDTFELEILRSKDYPGMNGGEASTKYGVITPKFVAHEASPKRGQLKAVRDLLNDKFKKELAD